MNSLLLELKPDQKSLVESVITDSNLAGAQDKKQLQLLLESQLTGTLHPPQISLALRQLIDELDAPDIAALPTSAKTREIADKLLASKQSASLQPRSIGNYRQVLYAFAAQFPDLPSQPEQIESYLSGKPSDTTRLWLYRVLSLLYQFANQRLGLPNVMTSIQKPRVKQKEPESLTLGQAKKVLDAIQTDRERALVYLYLGQGLRLSEALRLDIRDVGEDDIKIKGKERNESMPLLPEVRDAILKLTVNRGSDEPVFVGQRGRLGIDMAQENVKTILQRAGVDVVQKSPKIFRSTFASLAVDAGCDFYIVKRLLRHSGGWDVTHLHYIHLDPRELRNKLEKYSPLKLLSQHSEKLLEGERSGAGHQR